MKTPFTPLVGHFLNHLDKYRVRECDIAEVHLSIGTLVPAVTGAPCGTMKLDGGGSR